MGWFSEAVDWVQNQVAPAATAVVTAPVNFGNKYVVSPAKDVIAVNAEGTKNIAIGGAMTYGSGGLSYIGQQQDAQNILRNPTIGRASFGLSQDAADFASASGKFLSGGRATKSEEEGSLRAIVKGTAIAATPGAASAAFGQVAPANYLIAYGAGQAIQRGDYVGAAVGLAGEYVPGADEVIPVISPFLPRNPPASTIPSSPPGTGRYAPNPSTIYPQAPASSDTGFLGPYQPDEIPTALIAGLAAIIVLKILGRH